MPPICRRAREVVFEFLWVVMFACSAATQDWTPGFALSDFVKENIRLDLTKLSAVLLVAAGRVCCLP